jgi:hypothetical protein
MVKTAIALPQVVSRVPVRPLEWLTPPAARDSIEFDVPSRGERIRADVYRPGLPLPRPGIVMALGANELGGRDRRAVALADALARSGFVVLVMTGARTLADPDAYDPLELSNAPARTAAAFMYLQSLPRVDAAHIGFVGVCLGSGVCLLTASQPEFAGRVAFVFLIGPYFSLRSVLRAAVTQSAVDTTGLVRPWSPTPYGAERMRGWLLQALDPTEREQVHASPTGDSGAELSDRARATRRLLEGVSTDQADELIDTLDGRFLQALDQASPCGQLAGLQAPTSIMHSVDDGLIPVEESRHLAHALRNQVPLRYAEFQMFDHVDATRPLRAAVFAREAWRLAAHVEPLMRFAS